MARNETDREDLMREATAYARRAEAIVRGEPQPVFCGFRRSGALSVYFGGDPVFHFDAEGRLRRAFVEGNLYRTQGCTLARLRRNRSQTRSELLRTDLAPDELAAFLDRAEVRLQSLVAAHEAGHVRTTSTIPEGADVVGPAMAMLKAFLDRGRPLAPAVKGKK